MKSRRGVSVSSCVAAWMLLLVGCNAAEHSPPSREPPGLDTRAPGSGEQQETPDPDGGSPVPIFPVGSVLLVDGASTVQCRGEAVTVGPAAGSLELRAVGATDLGLVDGACTYRLAHVAGALEAPLPQHCDDGLSHYDLKKATVSALDEHRFHVVYDVVLSTDDDGVPSPCEVSTDATVRPAAPDDLCSPLGNWSASLATSSSPAAQPAAP